MSMCCSLISETGAKKILNPLIDVTMTLAKTQTFVPILGVIPAALTIITGLITMVIAIAMRFFIDPNALEAFKNGLCIPFFFVGYSIINIASLGMFAPINEYVTKFLSEIKGHKRSTAGFFDIFPTLQKGEQIKFLSV